MFAVTDMEVRIAMDGWSGFFIDSHYLYPPARRALENVGDMASLRVIDDFLAYLAQRSVAIDEESIRAFYYGREEAYLEALDTGACSDDPSDEPDWGQRFDSLAEQRWSKIESCLLCCGIQLVGQKSEAGRRELPKLLRRGKLSPRELEEVFRLINAQLKEKARPR